MASVRRSSAAALSATGCLLFAVAVRAQAVYPTFNQVDYSWAQNPQLFQNLWKTANTQTVRIAILGDSQETNPGGRGLDYIPRLDYEMWKRYGNVPETPLEGCSFYGTGSPYADWMLSGACASPGPSATRLAPDQILPGVEPQAYSTSNGASNVNGEYLGQLTLLQQDASGVDPAASIPTNTSYLNTTGSVQARIFAATNLSSGGIAYTAQPTDANFPNYYASPTASGTLELDLQSANFAVTSAATPPLPYAGNTYMALQILGTDDAKLTDIIGLRFFNQSYPQGVVFDTFSTGGYQTTDFIANHGNAGAMFAALGFEAVIIHYGANDSSDGVSAQQFASNIMTLMARVRSWTGNPTLPFILIADVYRTGLTSAQQTQFDMYVGAQLSIAQADSNVMVVNSRRLMDDVGWNSSSGMSGTFLVDGVHYTPYGAEMLAAGEAGALMQQVVISSCVSDSSSVTLQASETLVVDLGGSTACSGYGQFAVAQSLALNGATLDLALINGFVPASGQSFNILAAGTLSGTFGTIDLPALPAGLSWNTSALYTKGFITVVGPAAAANAAPVPPWALILFAMSVLGVTASRRPS